MKPGAGVASELEWLKRKKKKAQKRGRKAQKRHIGRVVKIRNTSGPSSSLNTAHVPEYGLQSYASRVGPYSGPWPITFFRASDVRLFLILEM